MGLFSTAWVTTVQYMRGSSIAGLSHAAKAKSYPRSVYWLLIFLFGVGFTLNSLYVLMEDFSKYPVITNSNLETKATVTFPAITICNMNRVHCLNLEDYIVALRTKSAEEDLSPEVAEEVDDLQKELIEMSINTGCRSQACYVLATSLGKRVGPSKDGLVWYMHDLDCREHINDQDLINTMCYYLYTMFTYDETVSEDVWWYSMKVYNETGCDYAEICWYISDTISVNDVDNPEVGEQMVVDCEYSTKKRRKREVSSENRGESDLQASTYKESEFMMRYMELDENTRNAIGHQMVFPKDSVTSETMKGFFISCKYRNHDCSDAKLWHKSNVPNYGNCFTFNAEYNKEDELSPRNSTLTGALNGLTVELFVDQLNYMMGDLSQSAGIRLSVHNPDSYPKPDEFGENIMPGSAASVALQVNEISRLPSPHPSHCFQSWDDTELDQSLMNTARPRYAKTDCTRFCLQHEIMKKCDCFHTQYDVTFVNVSKFAFKSGNGRPCQTAEEGTDLDCINQLRQGYKQEVTCPSCHSACSETEYSNSVTTALWPSNRYWTQFALQLGLEKDSVFDSFYGSIIKQEIQQNYLKVSVYFQTLNVREITQTKKYSDDSMLAAVGGSLSLFLGIAIILLFELMELAIDIVMNTLSSKK